jgi:hypothetical protein
MIYIRLAFWAGVIVINSHLILLISVASFDVIGEILWKEN